VKNIEFDNRAKWVGKKGKYDYYDWEVFVAEDKEVIEKIDHIIYFLHKTFPNPVRTISDKKNGFALKSRGWGEFEIGIQIYFKDNQTQQQVYWLNLSKSWE
jgi:transcription initiation factor IIF auxiliary subunit